MISLISSNILGFLLKAPAFQDELLKMCLCVCLRTHTHIVSLIDYEVALAHLENMFFSASSGVRSAPSSIAINGS